MFELVKGRITTDEKRGIENLLRSRKIGFRDSVNDVYYVFTKFKVRLGTVRGTADLDIRTRNHLGDYVYNKVRIYV